MDLDSLEISQIAEAKPRKLSENVIILYFVILGGACNIGWNATVNSFDYYATKFPKPDYNVSFVFPLAIYSAQMVSILVIPKLSTMISYHVRILTALIINIFIVFFLSIEADMFKGTFFGMSLIMALLFWLGFNNNLCYASGAGFASQVEGKYTAYFLIGMSMFGLVASSTKALILWIFSSASDEEIGPNLIYYIAICGILTSALVLHILFMRSEFYQNRNFESSAKRSLLLNTETSLDETTSTTVQPVHKPKRDFKTLFTVFKEVRFYLFLILVLYIQMDFPFPGVMLKKPMPGIANHTKTVSLMMTFTVFLVSGKKIAQYRNLYNTTRVVIVILLRFILVAFFIIQAATISIPVFNTIWFGYLNVALFGLTMGFSNVCLFVLGAEQVTGEKKEVSGFLSVFTLNIGAILGGFSSLLLKNIEPPQTA